MSNLAARHGRWTLVAQVTGGKHPKWLAQCDCGKQKEVLLGNLLRGKSRSCGCLRGEESAKRLTTHGRAGSAGAYKSWSHMKGRCLNKKDAAFNDYGGRGIKICERWMQFEQFLEDMGECPLGHSIERVDVNGHYEPSNCVWLPKRLQNRNTRKTRFSDQLAEKIRLRLSAGETASSLGREYGVSAGHIRQIRRNEIWDKGVVA